MRFLLKQTESKVKDKDLTPILFDRNLVEKVTAKKTEWLFTRDWENWGRI